MVQRYRKSYRIRQRRSLWGSKLLRFGLGSVIIIGVFAYFLLFASFFDVREVSVEGTQILSTSIVREVTEEEIEGKMLGITTKSILFVDTQGVASTLKKEFPAIDSVQVRRVFPSSIRVIISEREEVVVWCKFVEGTGACVGVDSSGIAFRGASNIDFYLTGPPALTSVAWGDRVVDPETLAAILDFKGRSEGWSVLRDGEVKVVEVKIVSLNRMHAVFSEGWEAYLNPAESIEWQSTKLRLVLEREVPKERRPDLTYIDLRFGDQAYVKYKGE